MALSSTEWVNAPREAPPFRVDAFVEEEDSYLTLSAESILRPPEEHPVRLMTEAHEAEEATPGTLVVRHRIGKPLTFLAIVHRLAVRPSWTEGWVMSALEALGRESSRRELRSLALPLLGTVHGRLDPARSLELTRGALEEVLSLERVWIIETKREPKRRP